MDGINNINLSILGRGPLYQPSSVYAQCGCAGSGQFSWDDMIRYFKELSQELKELRGRGADAGRRGDLNAAAGSVPSLSVENAVAIINEAGTPVCMDLGQSAASVGDLVKYLLSVEARGRFYMAAHNYEAGRGSLGEAASLYSQILNPSGTCGISDGNLIAASTGRPFLYLGWAQAVMARLTWMDILANPEAVLTVEELEAAVNSSFDQVDGLMGSAGGARGRFTAFVNSIPGISGPARAYFQDKLNREFAAAQAHVQVNKATLLLQAANALRVNNPETAKAAIRLARQYLLKFLNEMEIRSDPPEELTSALQSLAWAYSSMANLLEDDERGTGAECAQMATIIYKYMLNGRATLSAEEQTLLQNGFEGEEAIWDTRSGWTRSANYDNYLNYIQSGFQRVLAGTGHSAWSGATPYLPMNDSITLDLLGLAGTNELELYLNLADNLMTMRRYDEAQVIYDQILSLQKQSWMSESLFMRARIGKAQILTKLADDSYGREREYDLALQNTENAIDLCEKVLKQLLISAGDAGSVWKDDNYITFKYRRELLKAATTLAWAYSSQSRYLRELGRIDESLEFARKAEALYRSLRGDATGDFEEVFKAALTLIDSNYSHVPAWTTGRGRSARTIMSSDELRNELKTELNINDAFINVGLADTLSLQRRFTESADRYNLIIEAFEASRIGSRYYQRANLGLAAVQVEQAKLFYSQSGDLDSALRLLDEAQENVKSKTYTRYITDSVRFPGELSPLGAPTVDEWLTCRLLTAQIHGTRGYLLLQRMDRPRADEEFDLSCAIFAAVRNEIVLNDYSEDVLKEAYLTKSQLLLSWAEVLKIRGERDDLILAEAEAKFKEAIEVYGVEAQTSRTSLGRIDAEIGLVEIQAMRAKLSIVAGDFQAALDTFNENDENDLRQKLGELASRSAPRLNFRAQNIYARMLGLRGDIRERIEGEGRGREDFEKSAQVYADLLNDRIFTNPGFLILLETTVGQLMLMRAERLKSAAVRDAGQLHTDADLAYEDAITALSSVEAEHPLYYYSQLALRDAYLGRAENRITLGKLQEEEGDLDRAESSYREALVYLAPVLQEMIEKDKKQQRIQYLTDARVGLRTVSALTWALNSLGDLRENRGMEAAGLNAFVEYRAALLIYRALVLGDNPNTLTDSNGLGMLDGVKAEWTDPEIDLEAVVDLIRHNRLSEDGSILTVDEVLFAAEQNRWAARFGYLAALNSSRLFGRCGNVYPALVRDLEASATQGIFEMEYTIRAHAMMGDIHTFRLASEDNDDAYDIAEDLYGLALDLFGKYQELYHPLREMEELRQYINSGYAKALIENGEYHSAETRYSEILNCSFFQSIDQEVERDIPDEQKIADLRKKLTFKQIKILAQAYLGLGTLYTHYLRDGELAKQYYDYALRLLGATDTRAPINRMRGESYLGLGNVSLLRDREAEGALALFSEGARVLTERDLEQITLEDATRLDRKSREVLVRILSAASAAYAEKTNREKAEQLVALADQVQDTIPADPYEPDYQVIVEGVQETRVGNAENLASQSYSLEPYVGFRRSAFESQENLGFLAGFIGRAHLTNDLNIDVGYANLLAPADIPINKEIDRISFDRSHQLTAGIDWQAYEGDIFSLHLSPRFNFNYFGYDLNSCDWGTSYTSCTPLPVQDKSLLTYGFSLGTDFLVNHSLTPDLTLIWGGGIDASFLLRQGMYPSYDAQIASYREDIASLEQATVPNLERIESLEGYIEQIEGHNENFLFSFLGRAQIGLQSSPVHWGDDFMLYYPTLTIGGIFGYDQIAITEQGRWPLFPLKLDEETGAPLFEEIPAWRGAATLGGSTILAWGDEMQYRLPLSFNLQVGNFNYFDINAGFNFGLDWFEFMAGYSHYQDYRDNVVDNLNLGLRFYLP